MTKTSVAGAGFAHRSKILRISFLAILSAFAVEMAFGLISGSLALVADSIHALLDAFVTLMLLLAVKLASRPPDAEHTYGHGKMESLGGLFGGIAILAAAAFLAHAALSGLQGPPVPVGMLGLLGGAYAMGVDAFRVVLLRRSAARAGGAALRADLYHAAMDLGSTGLAIAGVALASSGAAGADSVAALALAALLAALSVKLVWRASLELTDVISPRLVEKARLAASRTPGVIGAPLILMRRSGDVVFVDATVSVRGSESFERAHEISASVEESIANGIPGASVTVHFEPSWEGVPARDRLERAALGVDGVIGVHNASVYRAGSAVLANLHVVVGASQDLAGAHRISDDVEKRVAEQVGGIDHLTVHLEPYVEIPDGLAPDASDSESEARAAASAHPDVLGISRTLCLRMGGSLKIEMDCSFDGSLPMSRVHDAISEVEGALRSKFPGAIVTIHPEPG